MIDEIQKDTDHRMEQTVKHTQMEVNRVRTGRANPELLDSIMVDYYGQKTPLSQLSNISVPEARLISIQPYEKTLIPVIEKAIMESNLGLTPSNNGNSILIPIPPLSEDRRKELIKYINTMVEEGRIAVRNVRRDANHQLKEAMEELHISEDEIKRSEQNIQDLTDSSIKSLGEIQEMKEKEILEF
ncbi:MAG: ribosome recycling factor [Candidatus Marinimicrobia bacterium]|nr:ribosome recycling factor [Candidatus Neomarinimicrobiota bacterium]